MAAYNRLKVLVGGVPHEWPTFTEAQVVALEAMFPPRCLASGEPVEDHLRYAGVVDFIALMREQVRADSDPEITLTREEEEALADGVGDSFDGMMEREVPRLDNKE